MHSNPTTSKRSGIYQIRCLANGKHYIGSTKSFKKRWETHLRALLGGLHHSRYLQRAWDKHGADGFAFEILELVPDWRNLVRIEQDYPDRIRPWDMKIGYNTCRTAGSTAGVTLTAEHRSKCSASLKGADSRPSTGRGYRTRSRRTSKIPSIGPGCWRRPRRPCGAGDPGQDRGGPQGKDGLSRGAVPRCRRPAKGQGVHAQPGSQGQDRRGREGAMGRSRDEGQVPPQQDGANAPGDEEGPSGDVAVHGLIGYLENMRP